MNRKRVIPAVLLAALVSGLATACTSSTTPSAAASPSAVFPTNAASSPGGSAPTPTQAAPGSPSVAPSQTSAASAPSAPADGPATPVLGTAWAPGVQGYGVARPSGLNNNGDPTGIVTGLHWSSWGGPSAHGTGTAEYVAPDQSVAQGTEAPATVVAFDLGICNGRPAYRAVEWYFPGHGQHFDPTRYFDPCTGQDHGM